MANRFRWLPLLAAVLGVACSRGWAADDPAACVGDIERVCAQLEDHLETCLAQRGDRLSPVCRNQLKSAMTLLEDPTGPAACIPDVQQHCPDLNPGALGPCIAAQKTHFSAACQQYLQGSQSRTSQE